MVTDENCDLRYQGQVVIIRPSGPRPDVTYVMSADDLPTNPTDVEIHIGWDC